MASKDSDTATDPVERLANIIEIYGRVMSAVMMLLGLHQWAIILGLMAGVGGTFETMSTPWQTATAHLAVVDLVASVGLWQRAAWGNVVWIYAGAAEIAMHTVSVGTFGSDYPIIAFHTVTVLAFVTMVILHRRAENRVRE